MGFDIDFRCRAGTRETGLRIASSARVVAVVGPSGIGKTTALNCIAGLLRPESGRIAVGGITLFDRAQDVDLPPHQRRVGYVFQDMRLFPHLTVAANLTYGERLANPADRWIEQDEVIDLLDIAALLRRHPLTLSGGEQRRVAIGRALLAAPRLLLLDEPFASLDPDRGGSLHALLERIRDRLAIPMLLVSHDRTDVARLAEDVVTLG